ncbi:MAG: cytochrome c biogenesis protein CcsA [Methanocellales archaeon]|nr:cytochrome c biogenesis protein CcsA [Methanocellales archaeon]
MNFGAVLIWLSIILSIISSTFALWYHWGGDPELKRLSKNTGMGCAVTTTLSTFLLAYHFLTNHYQYVYVYNHASMELPWYYRLSGIWAGQEGTILFWAWIILLTLVILERTKPYALSDILEVAQPLTMMIISFFLILLAFTNPFDTFGFVPSDGIGLNPLLRNPWMIFHPPVLFVGYATFTIPYAFAMGYLITGNADWTKVSKPWSRVSWLFLTLGIGIGGFWAYEVLGWGAWYWSWDPVETSSLVPWVTATAFLHCQSVYQRTREYELLTPALAITTFVLVIFATFVVRSGIWTSVHAFTRTPVGPLFVIFLAALIIFGIVLLWQRSKMLAGRSE